MWKVYFSVFFVLIRNLNVENSIFAFFTYENSVDFGKIFNMERTLSQLSNLWGKVLQEIKEELNDKTIFDSFFHNSYIGFTENKVLFVVVSSGLAVELITKRYLDLVNAIVAKVTQTNYTVKLIQQKELNERNVSKIAAEPAFFKNSSLNPDLTFENFVVGSSNREAYQASIIVAANRGKLYNPLFIYGDSGIGKTHLLHSIGNYIKKTEPNTKVLLFDTDAFIDEYTKAARGESDFNKFKEYINGFDIILVDDVQFLVGKKKTEEQFFVIFKLFHDSKKQIVLTCDRLPNELEGLESRLITRFNTGLPEKINKPESDVCLNFLKNKIERSGLKVENFDSEALEFLAEKFSGSIRELQGAFNKLLSYTINFKPTEHIDLRTAVEAVGDLLGYVDTNVELSEKKILTKVAAYFNLTTTQLTGNSHVKQISFARHISMYLMRELMDLKFKRIGLVFGGKDHSTVMSAITKVEKMLKTDDNVKQIISDLKSKIV